MERFGWEEIDDTDDWYHLRRQDSYVQGFKVEMPIEISHDGSSYDLVVDSSGNVGIGTTSPGSILEVASTGTADYLRLTNLTSGDILTVDSAGNVGIGISSPDYKLHITGTIGVNPGSSVTPQNNGDIVVEATNDTTLTFKLKGSDGVVRSGTITLS